MDKNYWELFFGESQEYLKEINRNLVILEKDPSDNEAVNEIFRFMHTIKGMAATMGFKDLAEFAHAIEDVFDEFRSGKSKVTPQVMDVVFACVDAFESLLEDLKAQRPSQIDIGSFVNRLKEVMGGGKEEKEKDRTSEVPEEITLSEEEINRVNNEKGKDFFRIDIELQPECPLKGARAFMIIVQLRRFGEIVKCVPPEEELKKDSFDNSFSILILTKEDPRVIKEEISHITEVKNINIYPYHEHTARTTKKAAPSYLKKIQSMRIPVERLDKVMNFVGELSIVKSRLVQILQAKEFNSLEETVFMVDRLVSSLQDEILQMRLLPISYILDTFPRIVRDLSRKIGKEIDLEIVGSEIELDRVVLDEIGDPLVHIVRNAIDHGIESKEERLKKGKPPRGKVVIKVSRDKGHVIIEVADDGGGIDFRKIAQRGVEKGLISPEEASRIDTEGVLDLMTMPGFSTSETVTDVSGRGVGLDVVKNKLDSLGGRLEFETEKDKGTRFILTLPLTLAIIKAMLVEVGKEVFAIPLMNIRESVKVRADEVKTVELVEVIRVRDDIVPLIRLDRELGLPSSSEKRDVFPVVIVEGRVKSLGLLVDKIIGEQDIVVKPLGSMVRKVKGIAGATILGDGRVALILDVVNLK